MRRASILLIPFVLAGCVRDSATYYAAGTNETITVRAEQEYFWDDRLRLTLAVARLPECQRVLPLVEAAEGVEMQLYATGEYTYTLKSADGTWTFDMQNCAMTNAEAAPGPLLGTYRLSGKDVGFIGAGQAAQE